MKNFTNYIAIDKNGKAREIINTHDVNFLARYNKAVRLGWTIVRGEQNEGYTALMARLGLR
jgi:hypothetical protein